MSCQKRILWLFTELWQVNTTLGLGPSVKGESLPTPIPPPASGLVAGLLAAPQMPGSKENMLCWASGVIATRLGVQ